MRDAPMNYLGAAAVGGLLWVVTGLLVGNYLGNNVSLQVLTTETFVGIYRGVLAAATVVFLLCCYYWFFRGARESASRELPTARRLWVAIFTTLIVLAVATVVGLAYLLRTEGLSAVDYVIVFGVLMVQTFLSFWLCTLLMTPRAWAYVVPGKR